MSFNAGLIFTNRGRILQAKAQTGTPLVFTRIAVGDGELGSQDISELTDLINPIKSLEINKFKTLPGGKAVVGAKLSNQDITTGFYWRELGLFANDPDAGEILYCYGNAGALAEYIPSPGGAEILEKQIDIVSIVGNAQNVSAIIDSSLVFVTQEDYNELVTVVNLHLTDENNPHNTTPEQIGAETPAGAQAKVDALAGEGNTKTVKQLDDELSAHLAESTQKFLNIDLNIIDIAVELEILKDATLNGVTANIFVETFQTLDDINLERGSYNQAQKRLEV